MTISTRRRRKLDDEDEEDVVQTSFLGGMPHSSMRQTMNHVKTPEYLQHPYGL